jgi:hypothetical protein
MIPVSSGNGGSGRDIDNTLPNSTLLLAVIKAATAELTAFTEQQQQIINALQKQLDINEQALNTIFKILDEKEVPVGQLLDKLIDSAEAIKKTLARAREMLLMERTSGVSKFFGFEIISLKEAVRNALKSGQLARADGYLERFQKQDVINVSELEWAYISEQRGHIAVGQLRNEDSEGHFANAAKRFEREVAASRAALDRVAARTARMDVLV